MQLKKIYKTALIERTLYHGTLVDGAKQIQSYGLIPMVGSFVSDMYDEYEEAGIDLPELTFATDKEQLSKAVNAIVYQVAKKLNKDFHSVTDVEIFNHGAIVKIADGEKLMSKRPRERNNYDDYPASVEPGDYYSEEGIAVDGVLSGNSMITLLKRYGEWPRKFGPGKENAMRKELLRLAFKHHREVPREDIIDKVASLSDDEVEDHYFYYLEA